MRVETISIVCPACGERTPKDIATHQGVHVHRHARTTPDRGRYCILIVAPDPEGVEHIAQPVPPHADPVTFLEAVLTADPALRRRHRMLLANGIEAAAA